jgi:hypothetical protein
MGAREVETPAGEPLESWDVAAVGPDWRPAPGEADVPPVDGRLELYADALVFRADDAATRARLAQVIPGASVLDAGPLSPGSMLTPSMPAGQWMPRALRRLRCPGFVVSTGAGAWAFDSPHGQRRARAVRERYGSAR